MEILGVKVLEEKHVGENGHVQEFKQIWVIGKSRSPTFDGYIYSDWLLISDDHLFICEDEYGECLVEYSAEFQNETLPLSPISKIDICLNERDLKAGLVLCARLKEEIKNVFGVDVKNIPIVNMGA